MIRHLRGALSPGVPNLWLLRESWGGERGGGATQDEEEGEGRQDRKGGGQRQMKKGRGETGGRRMRGASETKGICTAGWAAAGEAAARLPLLAPPLPRSPWQRGLSDSI